MLKNFKKMFMLGFLPVIFLQSCNLCKNLPINLAESSIPLIESNIDLNNSVDYGEMSWEEIIAYVKTPNQAQDYLDRYFKKNHLEKKGNCVDYAVRAAGLLIDDGFLPVVIGLKSDNSNHLIYLYRTEKGFSALGNTPIEKGYPKIIDLIKDFENEYYFHPKKYIIMELHENFSDSAWINSNKILNKRTGFWRYKKIK